MYFFQAHIQLMRCREETQRFWDAPKFVMIDSVILVFFRTNVWYFWLVKKSLVGTVEKNECKDTMFI
jgi:hypothetical protein